MHARIRAYGSLAAEVADAGVPGVVAMRYNVYVVTAAQYAADLYAHLLAGRPLGQAATAARRALAADPARQITTTPVNLQDWAVPVVYEAAPLALLRPQQRDAPLIKLSATDEASTGAGGGVPGPPDAGFFGRDETLLALDRAFDTQQVVLLHAFAGAGKSSTAAEFARWYHTTGGLDHPDLGAGPVLWSSFEHHLPVDRLLDTAGDCFAPLLEANGIAWQATTAPPAAGTWSCRCWRRCRCCGCGTTSSRSPGSRPAPAAPGPRPSKTTSRSSCATSLRRPGARCC